MKIDQNFLSIDFDSWSELSGSLMAVRKLAQEIQVQNATIQKCVWQIEICDKDQLQFHMHFVTKHTIGIIFATEKKDSTLLIWQHAISWVTSIIVLLFIS